MKIENKENCVVMRNTESNLASFVEKLSQEYNKVVEHNLVLDLSENETITLESLKLFTDLSKTHKKAKKSFVIVAKNINYNKIPVKMTVVPSLQEAQDIIEIEAIERDLGF